MIVIFNGDLIVCTPPIRVTIQMEEYSRPIEKKKNEEWRRRVRVLMVNQMDVAAMCIEKTKEREREREIWFSMISIE